MTDSLNKIDKQSICAIADSLNKRTSNSVLDIFVYCCHKVELSISNIHIKYKEKMIVAVFNMAHILIPKAFFVPFMLLLYLALSRCSFFLNL